MRSAAGGVRGAGLMSGDFSKGPGWREPIETAEEKKGKEDGDSSPTGAVLCVTCGWTPTDWGPGARNVSPVGVEKGFCELLQAVASPGRGKAQESRATFLL